VPSTPAHSAFFHQAALIHLLLLSASMAQAPLLPNQKCQKYQSLSCSHPLSGLAAVVTAANPFKQVLGTGLSPAPATSLNFRAAGSCQQQGRSQLLHRVSGRRHKQRQVSFCFATQDTHSVSLIKSHQLNQTLLSPSAGVTLNVLHTAPGNTHETYPNILLILSTMVSHSTSQGDGAGGRGSILPVYDKTGE
jgi:hypothetical protein